MQKLTKREARDNSRGDKQARKALTLLKTRLDASERFRRDSIIRPVFEKFIDDELVGGVSGISKFMAETHQLAKNSEVFSRRQTWAVFLRDLISDIDTNTKDAIEMEMDPEELHLQMVSGLLEMIRKDPEFSRAVILEAASTIAGSEESNTTLDELIESIEFIKAGNKISSDGLLMAGDVDA